MSLEQRQAMEALQAYEETLSLLVEAIRSEEPERIKAATASYHAAGKVPGPCGVPGHHVESLVAGKGVPIQCGSCLMARARARDAAKLQGKPGAASA